TDGVQGLSVNGSLAAPNSFNAVISANGQFIAFMSQATNLAGLDQNGPTWDIYVRDLAVGTTVLASAIDNTAVNGNSDSQAPAISADGRVVAFVSSSSDLTAEIDSLGSRDVFVRDTQTNRTYLASVRSDVGAAGGSSGAPSLSEDGRYVAFESAANNLVVGDNDFSQDVFLRDVIGGTTELIGRGNGFLAYAPILSGDASVVAYAFGFGGYSANVYVRNRTFGTTTIVSNVDGSSAPADQSGSWENSAFPGIALSANGRYVGFISKASTLTAGDTNEQYDMFVKDLTTGITKIMSGGGPNTGIDYAGLAPTLPLLALSNNGDVAFYTAAGGLVADDNNRSYDVFASSFAGAAPVLISTRDPIIPEAYTARDDSTIAGVSKTGRYVLFTSSSNDLAVDVYGGNSSAQHLYLRDTQTGKTERVSPESGFFGDPQGAVSEDGRYVAFVSGAPLSYLAPGTTDGSTFAESEVYLRDRLLGTTTLISRSSILPNTSANNSSGQGSPLGQIAISDDGNWVLYESNANDIAPGDTGNFSDVYLYDRVNDSSRLVSKNSSGASGNGNSFFASMTPDASRIVFTSLATNLAPSDANNNLRDVFVYDRATDAVVLVSANFGNTGSGLDASFLPVISDDGQYVAFMSNADNLIDGFNYGFGSSATHVFLRDLTANVTKLVDVQNGSAPEIPAFGRSSSIRLSISADGKSVLFGSLATDLVYGDNFANTNDIFVRDVAAGVTHQVTRDFTNNFAGNNPTNNATSRLATISPDGRFVAFYSTATNLIEGFIDQNDIPSWGDSPDLYLRDLFAETTTLVTQDIANPHGGSDDQHSTLIDRLEFSGDGKTLVFQIASNNLYLADRNVRPPFYGTTGLDVYAFDITALGIIRGRVFN
ncbi:MAG: hypothetical protein WCL32_22130, partial [Planctomycetota bacterium]